LREHGYRPWSRALAVHFTLDQGLYPCPVQVRFTRFRGLPRACQSGEDIFLYTSSSLIATIHRSGGTADSPNSRIVPSCSNHRSKSSANPVLIASSSSSNGVRPPARPFLNRPPAAS